MSEFDKLKDDAEQYAKDHPQQVHEAEQDIEHAVENKVDPGGQQGQDDQQAQGDDGNRDASQSGQGQGQGLDPDQGQGQGQGQ